MLYPVMAAPPVLAGAVQLRLMMVCPSAVALSDVGAPGAVAASVVAFAVLDQSLLPSELMALTR